MTELSTPFDELRSEGIDRKTVGWVVLLGNIQLLAVVSYFVFLDVAIAEPRYVLYGLIWVNVGGLVIWQIDPPTASFPVRRRAIAIAAAYFGLLAVAGGMINSGSPEFGVGYRLALLPPGWGPALVFASPVIRIVVMPAYIVGYVALSYLVYDTILATSRSAIAGALGLFSCVSCTWPIIAGVTSTILGGGTLLAATALEGSYDLSTLVFLGTVALLYWRPGVA